MALIGVALHAATHIPQPIQLPSFITGKRLRPFCSILTEPFGHAFSQASQSVPSVIAMQFFFSHTARPILMSVFSSTEIFFRASVGHISLHFVQSHRQQLSVSISWGIMSESMLIFGWRARVGHTSTQSWQALHKCDILSKLSPPAGMMGLFECAVCLFSMIATPLFTFSLSPCIVLACATLVEKLKKRRLLRSVGSVSF